MNNPGVDDVCIYLINRDPVNTDTCYKKSGAPFINIDKS